MSELVNDFKNMETQYAGIFPISYADFSRNRLVEVPNDKLIEQWIIQTLKRFKEGPIDPETIMQTFQINERDRVWVEKKQFMIRADGARINTEKKILFVRMIIKITPLTSVA